MTGFKRGDRVRIVYPEGGDSWHDRVGTVDEARTGTDFPYIVKLDQPSQRFRYSRGAFSESQLVADPADVPWGRIAQDEATPGPGLTWKDYRP